MTYLSDRVFRQPTIQQMVPPTGLARAYVARAQRLTDAPSVYHLGAFLSMFGAVVSPRARLLFQQGDKSGDQPLHLWVLLTGKSNNRKSYAIDLANAAFAPFLGERMCPDSGSREGFEEFFYRKPNAVLAVREAPTWLADNHTAWMRNGSAWWCKVFDGWLEPKLMRKKDKGPRLPDKIAVCVTICAAGETSAVMAATKRHPADWSGGMFSRMLVLSAEKGPESDQWFDWKERDLAYLRGATESVLALVRRSPHVTISKEAWAVYQRWYAPVADTIEALPLAQAALVSRLSRHAKVVGCLHALGDGTTVVSAEHMAAATQLVRYSHQKILGLPLPMVY